MEGRVKLLRRVYLLILWGEYKIIRMLGETKIQDKRNKEFLNRFEGRTSTIGKTGLLSILQKNIGSSNQAIPNKNYMMGRYAVESKPKQPFPEPQTRPMMMQMSNEGSSNYRASNRSFRSESPRKVGPKSTSIPKLPQLTSHNKNFQLKSSLQLHEKKYKNLDQMDKETVKHLQFLDMFEQRCKVLSKKL